MSILKYKNLLGKIYADKNQMDTQPLVLTNRYNPNDYMVLIIKDFEYGTTIFRCCTTPVTSIFYWYNINTFHISKDDCKKLYVYIGCNFQPKPMEILRALKATTKPDKEDKTFRTKKFFLKSEQIKQWVKNCIERNLDDSK